jgi:hypothetical protein
MLRDMNDFVGRYYSNEWVRRNVLYQTEEDMKEIDEQIVEEQDNPQYQEPLPTQPSASGQPPQQGGQPGEEMVGVE